MRVGVVMWRFGEDRARRGSVDCRPRVYDKTPVSNRTLIPVEFPIMRTSGASVHTRRAGDHCRNRCERRPSTRPALAAPPDDDVADWAIGAPSGFTTNAINSPLIGPATLNFPKGTAWDAAGNLYVADASNNRVLRFDSPITTDVIADGVYGQPNLTDHSLLHVPRYGERSVPADGCRGRPNRQPLRRRLPRASRAALRLAAHGQCSPTPCTASRTSSTSRATSSE